MAPLNEINPKEIMTLGAERDDGVTVTFESGVVMQQYRMRCYAARNREEVKLQKTAIESGVPVGMTGWEDLVFMPREDKDGVKCKLWIGVATAETYGILNIE